MKILVILLALAFAQVALADLQVMRLKIIQEKGKALKVRVTPPAEKKRSEAQTFTIPEAVAYFQGLEIFWDGAWVEIQRDGVPYSKLLPVLRSMHRNRYVRMTSVDGKEVNLAKLIEEIEQDGADQAATAAGGKPKEDKKPKKEAKPRSQ